MSDLPALLAKLRDLHAIDPSETPEEQMPNFPTHALFLHNLWHSPAPGDPSLSYQRIMPEDNGTHVDAPAQNSRRVRHAPACGGAGLDRISDRPLLAGLYSHFRYSRAAARVGKSCVNAAPSRYARLSKPKAYRKSPVRW